MVAVLSIHSLNSSPVLLENYNLNSVGLQYRAFFYRKKCILAIELIHRTCMPDPILTF